MDVPCDRQEPRRNLCLPQGPVLAALAAVRSTAAGRLPPPFILVQGVSRSRPPGEICPSENFPAKMLDLNEIFILWRGEALSLPLLFR
eukprot:COSAG06_NODE_52798_length_303_cov_2.230392_1_plen_87_part_01